jgi:hypothetical protein
VTDLSSEYAVLNKSPSGKMFAWGSSFIIVLCFVVAAIIGLVVSFQELAKKNFEVLEGQKKLEESEHKVESARLALLEQKEAIRALVESRNREGTWFKAQQNVTQAQMEKANAELLEVRSRLKASTETDPLLKRKLEAEAKEAEAKADLAKTRAISQAKIENEARVQQEKAELASETAQKKADMAISQAEASGLMLLREGARLRAKSTITSSLIYENSTGNFKGPSYIQKDSILIIGAITPFRFEVIDFKSNSSIGWIDLGKFGIFFENAQ